MKRSELKQIIKECIIEILAEGIGADGKEALAEAAGRSRSLVRQRGEEIKAQKRQQSLAAAKAMKAQIDHLTGGDKLLSEILSHTAVETLPTMIEAPDPERMNVDLHEMLGGGGGGSTEFFSGFAQGNPQRNVQDIPVNPAIISMWEKAAFGENKRGNPFIVQPPPPMKLSQAELDRKVQ